MNNSLDEYKSVSENIRWYSHMRFAQLTLFSGLTAAIFTLAFSQTFIIHTIAVGLLKIGGVAVCLSHWILEARADEYWAHYMERAEELEKKLKFKQYTMRPRHRIRTSYIIRGLLGLIAVFWTVSLMF